MIRTLQSGRLPVRKNRLSNKTKASKYGRRYNEGKRSDKVLMYTNASEYRRVFRCYLGEHIFPHFALADNGLSLRQSLVVHLRGGDAVARMKTWWSWQPEHMINYFLACVKHSSMPHIHILSQTFEGPNVHPALRTLQQLGSSSGGFRVSGSAQTLRDDFATMMHARYFAIDFSTLSFAAALFSQQLVQIYVPLLTSRTPTKKMRIAGYDLQHGPGIGFTLPPSLQLRVFHVSRSGAIEEQGSVYAAHAAAAAKSDEHFPWVASCQSGKHPTCSPGSSAVRLCSS